MKNSTLNTMLALGVILLVLLVISMYWYQNDSITINELTDDPDASQIESQNNSLSGTVSASSEMNAMTSTSTLSGSGVGFALSAQQVEALVSLGIDPESVPSSITTEQEQCFVAELGESRVLEIKGGAVPNAFEFLKVKSCI